MITDNTSNMSGITVDHRARKYYEGWAHHSPLNGRVCIISLYDLLMIKLVIFNFYRRLVKVFTDLILQPVKS